MSTTTFAYDGSFTNASGTYKRINEQPKVEAITDADITAMGLEDPDEDGITQTERAQRAVRNIKRVATYKTNVQKFDEAVRARLGLKPSTQF